MTRDQIERALKLPLMRVHLSGMQPTAVARERERENATENVLNMVETICQEVEQHVTVAIAKSARNR